MTHRAISEYSVVRVEVGRQFELPEDSTLLRSELRVVGEFTRPRPTKEFAVFHFLLRKRYEKEGDQT